MLRTTKCWPGQRCRADLQFLTEHRGEVDALRAKLDDLLGRAADTDRWLAGMRRLQARIERALGDAPPGAGTGPP